MRFWARCAFHVAHACTHQHRECNDGKFPKVDRIKAADPRARVDAGFCSTKTDRQAVNGTCAQKRQQLRSACHLRYKTPERKQAAVVFAQLEPDTSRFGRIVLEQHRNTTDAARRQRIAKSAAHDHIARLIDFTEQACITLDGAVGIDGCAWREDGGDGRFG